MANETTTLLQKVTVGAAGASSITFSNIPQTYTDLVILCSTRLASSGIEALDMRFNGNTGSNYNWRYIQGNGSGFDNGSGTNATAFTEAMVTNGNTSTANTFSSSTLYIPNYTSSNNKSFSLDTVEEENATAAYMRLKQVFGRKLPLLLLLKSTAVVTLLNTPPSIYTE